MSKGRYRPKGPRSSKGPRGGPQDMFKQLQKVQEELDRAQEELAGEIVEHSAGGGMVKVEADGQQNVRSITIDPEAVDPEDVEMLEDMVLAAVKGALEKSQQLASERMGGITGVPGMPGLPGLM